MTGIKVKAIYLILYMAYATWRVFYNVYLEENNFTGVEIGVINALFQSTLFIVVPIWGVIADKRGIRPSLRIAIGVAALLVLLVGNMLNFWWLIIFIFVLTLFYHPTGPLVDALAIQFAESDRKKYNYGNLRMWGSLGWAIASISGGYLFIKLDLKYSFPIAASLFLVTILFLRTPKKPSTKLYHPHFEQIKIRDIAKNKALLFFLFILFLFGVASSPVNSFMNLYLTELSASNYIVGLVYSIQALSEIPFFILGTYLLKHLGAKRVIVISMLVMVIRLFMYAIYPSITVALIMGAFQGITLSFFLVGVVDFLHRHLPKSRHATAQSILWGLYFGIGQTVGNLTIGFLKDMQSMVGVMLIFAFLTLTILILTFIDFWIVYRRSKRVVLR
jgi:MFS transporter, PPP family, 3-phenylpropionic acid transporter